MQESWHTAGRDQGSRFVKLATVGNLNIAHIMAARLASEGIEVRLHGGSLGPYPVTVGRMAETELWVLSDRVDEASEVMLDAEVNDVLEPVVADSPPRRGLPIEIRAVAAVVGCALAALYLMRVVAVF